MKKFMLVLFVALAYVRADDSSSSEEDVKRLTSVLQSRLNTTVITGILKLSEKTKQRCPDIEDQLKSTIEQIGVCMKEIDLGSETLCSLVRNNLERCAKPATKLLVGCLPEESKGLPVLAIKTIKAIIDEACNSTVEQVLELFNPCVMAKEFESFEACTKIKNILTEYRNKVPSKSLVCSTIPQIKSCLKSHREASCTNPITKQAAFNFHEAIDEATASECQDVNKVT